MKTVIIKYNAGNICSVDSALKRLGVAAKVTDNIEDILTADKVIFPGVGEASSTMNYLRNNKLDRLIRNLKQPVLGICLGMQLMCSYSEEGNTDCLGVFDQKVLKFKPSDLQEKIPHMGWNALRGMKSKLFNGIEENSYLYFVHSYYAETGDFTIATTNYVNPFSAALQKDNFFATQFHPEKSGAVGLQILKNFIEL